MTVEEKIAIIRRKLTPNKDILEQYKEDKEVLEFFEECLSEYNDVHL